MKMFARKNQVVGGIGKFMINRSLYERQTAFNIIYIMRTNMCNGSIVMSACGSIQMSALW